MQKHALDWYGDTSCCHLGQDCGGAAEDAKECMPEMGSM